LGAILVVAIVMMPPLRGGTRERAEAWLSLVSGPFACWIEVSWDFKPSERLCYTLFGLGLALGMLAHRLGPHWITAVLTACASSVWFFAGLLLTYRGWG